MWFMKKLGFMLLPLLLVPVLQAEGYAGRPRQGYLEKVCTACHDLGPVTSMAGTAEIWQSVIDDMKGRGADGTDADFKSIVVYLAKSYGPPVKINTDTAKDIETNLGVTTAEAAAIVKYRTDKGPFKAWADVAKVPGLDAAKLDGVQRRIKY